MAIPEFQIIPQCKDSEGEYLILTLSWTTDSPPAYSVCAMVRTEELVMGNVPNSSVNWTPVEWIQGGNDLGFILMNQATNMVLIAPEQNQSVQVKSMDTLTESDNAFWKYNGSGDGGALQLMALSNKDLNVFGDGPYGDNSTVGVWSWGHGQPNEMWILCPAYQTHEITAACLD